MKIIKPRSVNIVKKTSIEFQHKYNSKECEYSFPCDREGNIDTSDKYYMFWKFNYEKCENEVKLGNMIKKLQKQNIGIQNQQLEFAIIAVMKCCWKVNISALVSVKTANPGTIYLDSLCYHLANGKIMKM